MTTNNLNVKNIVVVGDGAVGKTCLLHRFHGDDLTDEYIATVYDKTEFEIEIDGEVQTVKLHDTAGQEEYDRLRRIIYRFADVFILCYSVDRRESFMSVRRWATELRNECKDVPIVLCATKIDLRSTVLHCVTKMEGEEMKTDIKAFAIIECSARRDIGVKDTIYEAVRAISAEVEEEPECEVKKYFCCINYLKRWDIKCLNKIWNK